MAYNEFDMLPEEAFKPEAGHMRLHGGKAPAQPSSTTVAQTSIPEYAKPYVEDMLGKASALSSSPFVQYPGAQVAGFSPMQQHAFSNIQGMTGAQQIGTASDMAAGAGLMGLAAGASYNPMALSMQSVGAPQLQQYSVGTGAMTDPGKIDAYMSPYMQNVVDIQKREANRDYGKMQQQIQAEQVGRGAFGGNRGAILEAENRRNLGTKLSDIQATGQQGAYEQAQQGYMSDAARQLAAQQANQGANIGVQQLGAGQDMQAQQANQATFQQMQQQAQQAQQFGADVLLRGAGAGSTAAGQLGALGSEQFSQQQAINNALYGAGTAQQTLGQEQINAMMQNFANQQNSPYQRLGYMSDMLRGLPMSQTSSSMYVAPPSLANQAVGLAGLALANKG